MEESGSSGADGTGQGFICLCSISGDADRWMYGCTQLLPWNNVITPINSHVTLDPPAGPETRIPPPLSFHSFCSQQRGYAVSPFSHAGDRSAEFGVNSHVPDRCILKLNPPPIPCSQGQLEGHSLCAFMSVGPRCSANTLPSANFRSSGLPRCSYSSCPLIISQR